MTVELTKEEVEMIRTLLATASYKGLEAAKAGMALSEKLKDNNDSK